jgi:hypothetical protein
LMGILTRSKIQVVSLSVDVSSLDHDSFSTPRFCAQIYRLHPAVIRHLPECDSCCYNFNTNFLIFVFWQDDRDRDIYTVVSPPQSKWCSLILLSNFLYYWIKNASSDEEQCILRLLRGYQIFDPMLPSCIQLHKLHSNELHMNK